jgi:hypothetical protein
MKSELLTIDDLAAYLSVKPGYARGLVERGNIKARQDGLISEHALFVFLHRQQRITRRYVELWNCGRGRKAEAAWKQAVKEEEQRHRAKAKAARFVTAKRTALMA